MLKHHQKNGHAVRAEEAEVSAQTIILLCAQIPMIAMVERITVAKQARSASLITVANGLAKDIILGLF
jgi:hypothetical protein